MRVVRSTDPLCLPFFCSMFALLSLHIFLYGCNLFMWKNTRINHNFIFEFSSSTALKHRDAFLICTSFMTTVVGAMIIQLMLKSTGFSKDHVNAHPGVLLLVIPHTTSCGHCILFSNATVKQIQEQVKLTLMIFMLYVHAYAYAYVCTYR